VEQLPIFIYGTLRESERNHSLIAGFVERTHPGTLRGALQIKLDDAYPYPCLVPGEGQVIGELVYLQHTRHHEVLQLIDTLEEYDPRTDSGTYLRRRVNVSCASGSREAWTYIWNGPLPAGTSLPDGDFCRWSRLSQAAGATRKV